MNGDQSPLTEIKARFGESIILAVQTTADETLTLWTGNNHIKELLIFLKCELIQPYQMLFDLTAIDERRRLKRPGQPYSDFTIVYHLTSFGRNEDIRIKVPLIGEYPETGTITDIWPSANWYEREVFDLFGIKFAGHPCLRRILLPKSWNGHPLRKEYPARATEAGPFVLDEQMREIADHDLKFDPAEWGLETHTEETDFMFLNLGPQHPGTHGLLRLILQLDGEDIVDIVPDIGFHHRGAEKMASRRSRRNLPFCFSGPWQE